MQLVVGFKLPACNFGRPHTSVTDAHAPHAHARTHAHTRSSQAPGYSQIIKRPMAISNMREKVEQGTYQSWDELQVRHGARARGCWSWGFRLSGASGDPCTAAVDKHSRVLRADTCTTHHPRSPCLLLPAGCGCDRTQADITLMVANAKVYNHPVHAVHKQADVIFAYSIKYVSFWLLCLFWGTLRVTPAVGGAGLWSCNAKPPPLTPTHSAACLPAHCTPHHTTNSCVSSARARRSCAAGRRTRPTRQQQTSQQQQQWRPLAARRPRLLALSRVRRVAAAPGGRRRCPWPSASVAAPASSRR
jgi:hypothetical protein